MSEVATRQPCDSFFISNLLGTFLRSEPDTNPTVLPSSRLAELRERAAQCFVGQANLLDSIGSLFCISLYCAITAKFDDENELIYCTLLLQTVAVECLSLFQSDVSDISFTNGGTVQILNPDETLLTSKTNGTITPKLNDVFRDALALAKDLIRDLTRQVRDSHDKLNQNSKEPKDCLVAHSIYFMCCFGITHIAIVLKSSSNFNAAPGMIESLLVISLSNFRRDESKVVHPAVETKKFQNKNDTVVVEVRLERCLTQAAALGFVAVSHCFDERVLQEVDLILFSF